VHRFLGKDMPMPAGPAQLARAARAPVLPVATLAATPQWRFALQPPLTLGQDTLEADVATLVGATERIVLDQPQLWSWQQRRWRKFPLAVAS
jgi:lauroyl/myristoyl acyltransferase